MKTIPTRLTVSEDGQISLSPQLHLAPGEYNGVLVLEEKPVNYARQPLHFPVIDVGRWPQDLSLRREDMYGDDGR
jgi:hypothetical protein